MFSEEELSILLFLETYFDQGSMSQTLGMLHDPRTKSDDLRMILESYRKFYRYQQN